MNKPSCIRHKRTVERYQGTTTELINDIGDLHYESLAQFLEELRKKILADGHKDIDGGRKKLGLELLLAAHYLKLTKMRIDDAWKLSKPFMK